MKDLGKCAANEVVVEFIHLLFYNVRFRDYTQKTLELMFSGFLAGYEVGSITLPGN
jgi:hypothetical protein